MIELRDLTVRYPGARSDALRSLSLVIPEGAFVAVMGGNGSGKSTLARSLNGLLRPERGLVSVDGLTTGDDESCRAIRRKVGIVFQNPHLQTTSLTVEREVAFGLQNIGTEAGALRRIVDARLAGAGLEGMRARAPRSLSGGEQQRLALASVLAMSPAYLVLDEATSLLSPSSRTDLLLGVEEARRSRGMAVILITQFPEEAMRAGRLLILRGGVLVAEGPPADVFAHCAASGVSDVSLPLRTRLGLQA